ncbi:hypothetical protein M405DRAFT_934573 [Rhizopogon salebrosus TDB-379]|nr:hypothetical protein M405DRAFT_934573 [Rhizopogon salebrosus TDB-379]
MIFEPLVVLAAAALAANAQSLTTSSASALPSGLTPCIIQCSSQAAASSGCSSYIDLTCVCSSSAFQTAAGACLQANCTAADIQAATQIQTTECSSLTSNSTTTTSSSATLASTASHSSSTSLSSSSATSSGAATALVPSLALNGAFGGLIALAGALVGAALVL